MMTEPACPICGEPAHPEHRPFCSARHRDRDLIAWLDEGYRIPARADEEAAEQGLDKPVNRD